jgi:hypothetical protein
MQTIFCANISDTKFIQVTDNEIRLVGEVGTSLISSWRTPNGEFISAVAIDGNEVRTSVLYSTIRTYVRFNTNFSSLNVGCSRCKLKTTLHICM